MSDGANTYVYDSANRLVSVNSTETYTYNGLGDRLTQNGTQYVLDLNAGLTQVLSDGENSYVYGLGRISQTNTTTEYFLGDALGSVRQLSMTDGEIPLAQSYDPYGVVTYAAGTSSTPYGFTGETTDANGLVYLRARYYNPADARFMSRDTWAGDYNSPLSLNRWMYVEGNPVNYVDPSGNRPYPPQHCVWDPGQNVPYVETFAKISKSDWLNTYAMAGVAVQCWAESYDWKVNDDYDGQGPGKITNKEKETPYGERIPNPKRPNKENEHRGYGILCYTITKFDKKLMKYVPCTICKTEEEMDALYGAGNYKQENPHDQTEKSWAIEYMRRRIKLATDACIAAGCSSTDIYIVAALAQNGPGFTKFNLIQDGLTAKANRINEGGITIKWFEWFRNGSCVDTSQQLNRFEKATDKLKTWYMPRDINFNTIHELQRIHLCPN